MRRRFARREAKVLAIRNTARSKLDSTVALFGIPVMVAGLETIGDEEQYVNRLMERYFGPEPEWPNFDSLSPAPDGGEDDRPDLTLVTSGRS